MTIGWVIQENLLDREKTLKPMITWCKKQGVPVQTVTQVPFSDQLPDVQFETPIFYGTSTLVQNALSSPFFLYAGASFSFTEAFKHSDRSLFLNLDAQIEKAQDVLDGWGGTSGKYVRPDEDVKLFNGGLFDRESLSETIKTCKAEGLMDDQTKLLHAEPKEIRTEWRCVVVEGKVISMSMYCHNGRRSPLKVNSSELLAKAAEFAKSWTPAPVCVMDIASLEDGRHGILEFNNFHGSGWYSNDIAACMAAITKHYQREFA